MATLKSANVTKYDAGGSGDNYIADGYIKSVEKVWIDTYTNTTNAIGSADTILIGYIPKNKKITDIVVYMPALCAGKPSNATIFLGSASTVLVTEASTYLGALQPDGYQTTGAFNLSTDCTLRLKPAKFATVTDKRVGIYMRILQTNLLATTVTAATIRTVIKYT